MAVLKNVLEALEQTDVNLEAYGRSGELVRKVNSVEFLALIRANRQAFRGWDVDGRKVLCLLFRPEEAIEFLIATLAAMSEGWTIVPLYPNWSDEEQRMYLKTYRLRAVAVGQGFLSRALSWQGQVVDKVLPVSVDACAVEAAEVDETPLFAALSKDHPCAWIFTSGPATPI